MTLKATGGDSYRMFGELREFGFVAGVTLKGPWEDQIDVYGYIRDSIVPPNYRMVVPNQVHSSRIIHLDGDVPPEFDADGVLTERDDLCLTITTADCLPLLAADPASGYFAAVHVGWRSFVAGIVDNLFQIGCRQGMDLAQTCVFLGPSIGSCCFEVGPEVAILFDESIIEKRNGNLFVDLRRAVGNKVISQGVVKKNIGGILDCTSCEPAMYYSYRRDKKSPVQMVTFIYKSIK